VTLSGDGYLMTREAKALGSVGSCLYRRCHTARLVLARWIRHRVAQQLPQKWSDIYRAGGGYEPGWQRVEAEYERMLTLTRSIDAQLVVIHIPERALFRPGVTYPAERLGRWAATHGAAFIDTLPALQAAAKRGERLYWPVDPHCNAAGYQVIADTVTDALVAKGLVP
jgi:hypothetical protein